MGGTVDGEIYAILNEKHKRELELFTNQRLIPLNESEVDLARLIDEKENRARLFKMKQESGKDDITKELEEEIDKDDRKFLDELKRQLREQRIKFGVNNIEELIK